MAEYGVVLRRAEWFRLLGGIARRLIFEATNPNAGYGWPPSYVDLTTANGEVVRTIAGPMDYQEAEQLAAQVQGDLNGLDQHEFAAKYLH